MTDTYRSSNTLIESTPFGTSKRTSVQLEELSATPCFSVTATPGLNTSYNTIDHNTTATSVMKRGSRLKLPS